MTAVTLTGAKQKRVGQTDLVEDDRREHTSISSESTSPPR
jgi:hypothetical protein